MNVIVLDTTVYLWGVICPLVPNNKLLNSSDIEVRYKVKYMNSVVVPVSNE